MTNEQRNAATPRLNFSFSEEHEAYRKEVQRFARDVLAPRSRECNPDGHGMGSINDDVICASRKLVPNAK